MGISLKGAGYCLGLVFLLLHIWNDYVHQSNTALSFVPYFLFGMVLYQWHKEPPKTLWVGTFLVYGLMLLHYIRYIHGQIGLGEIWLNSAITPAKGFSVALVVILTLMIMPPSRLNVSESWHHIDRWFGDLSYPLYLNHYVVVVAFASLVLEKNGGYQLVAIALSLALAYAMKAIVELPLQGVRDKLRGRSL